MLIDPEEPEWLGPRWANGHTQEEREFLRSIHFDYVRVARVEKDSDWKYIPESVIAEDEKDQLVAWSQVSPSQIESYQKCNRLWFFKSVMRLPELQKGNQALGEGVHLILEVADRVPKGDMPRLGYEYNHTDVPNLDSEGWAKATALATLMVPIIPRSRPGRPVIREAKITLDTYPGGPTMIGYMDLGVPVGIGWPELLIPDTAAIVGDYKTTSDFRYMKTPEELADSVQMMTYAKWAIEDLPGVISTIPDIQALPQEGDHREIYLAHLYGRTKPPFTKASIRHSVACVTVDQINAKWEKTLDTVRQMDQDAKASDAQDVKPTGVLNDHCSAYGGCAYRDRCGLNQPNPIKNLFIRPSVSSSPTEAPDMSNTAGGGLLAKIQEARRKAAQGQPEAASTTPTAPATESEKTETVSTPAPVAETPSVPSEPSKGPISTLMNEIKAANGGHKPMLSGLVALMYSKEQGIDFKPGASLAGTGPLASVNCKSMADLVNLKTKGAPLSVSERNAVLDPPKAAPSVATGIVPADAPPREQPVITKPGDGVDPVKANAGTVDPEAEIDDGSEEAQSEAQAPQTAQASTSAPRRGRPSNAEIAARKAEEAAKLEAEIERRVAEKINAMAGQVVMATDAQTVAKLSEQEGEIAKLTKMVSEVVSERDALKSKLKSHASQAPNGFALFVDCYPIKGLPEGTIDYLDWYAPIAAGIKEDLKTDWRMIDYKSKGVLAEAMRLVVGNTALPHAMTISMSAPGADVAMEVLSPFARTIVRRM